MRRTALALLLLLSLPLSAARRRAAGGSDSLSFPAVDAIAAQAIAGGVPGLVIGIRQHNATFIRAYGEFDLESHTPMRTGSPFQIGSVTKQFTAAAILRLAEEGKLHVDDRARVWLPELDERFDAITIRHLLTHTSAVADYSIRLTSAYEPKSEAEIVALITRIPPLFAAGARFQYSNSGYFLLGMIVERASGRTYAAFLRDTFFTPLGLGETSYCDDAPDGYGRDAATGTIVKLPAADRSLLFSAGALCSTANDLLNWSHALGHGLAVSPDSFAQMTTPVVTRDMGEVPYGFGLVVDTLDGRRRIWHNGQVLGYTTHLAWFPDEELTITVLTNVIDTQTELATKVAEEVARTFE